MAEVKHNVFRVDIIDELIKEIPEWPDTKYCVSFAAAAHLQRGLFLQWTGLWEYLKGVLCSWT